MTVGADEVVGGGCHGVPVDLVRVEQAGRLRVHGEGPMPVDGWRRLEGQLVAMRAPSSDSAVAVMEPDEELLLGGHVATGPDEVLDGAAQVGEPEFAHRAGVPAGRTTGADLSP